jgi:hypothetical protein
MEDLYLRLKNEDSPIDQNIIEKYSLEKGSLSPFTRNRIVDSTGDYSSVAEKDEKPESEENRIQMNDLGNPLVLTTAEMIDITQGVDSNP